MRDLTFLPVSFARRAYGRGLRKASETIFAAELFETTHRRFGISKGNMPPRKAKSPTPQRPASSPALQLTGSMTMPTLENWKWTAGNTVTGNVYGKPGTPDGTQMMTGTVPPEGKLGTHVVRVLPQSARAAATAAAAAGCCACGRLFAWLRVHVPLTHAVALSR